MEGLAISSDTEFIQFADAPYNLALQPGSFERTGSSNTTSFGYRYVVILGIRF